MITNNEIGKSADNNLKSLGNYLMQNRWRVIELFPLAFVSIMAVWQEIYFKVFKVNEPNYYELLLCMIIGIAWDTLVGSIHDLIFSHKERTNQENKENNREEYFQNSKKTFEELKKLLPSMINPELLNDVAQYTNNYRNYLQHAANNEDFKEISKDIIERHVNELEKLSTGKIETPMGPGINTQKALMKRLNKRMDAVSYNDIKFWSRIFDQTHIEPGSGFEADSGRSYYDTICNMQAVYKTEVTRIFLIKRSDLNEEKTLEIFADILCKHIVDEIGVAIAFVDVIDEDIFDKHLRLDFALFNEDGAATFFRDNRSMRKFQAVFGCTPDGKSLIAQQKSLHERLVTAAIAANKMFIDRAKTLHEKEWNVIVNRVKMRRENAKRIKSDDTVFSVILPSLCEDFNQFKNQMIESVVRAKVASEAFKGRF